MSFAIDFGPSGGSGGPFISWTSEGSARKGLAPESWVLRQKDPSGQGWLEQPIGNFAQGVAINLESLKIGWEKDGGKGVAPQRVWNPSPNVFKPRPDDSQKPGGGFVWTQALSIDCALGGGQVATWEQAAFGAIEAFRNLGPQLSAQYQAGMCPVVRMTGVDRRSLPNGSTSVPVLEVVQWVPTPECFKPSFGGMTPPPAAPAAPVAPPPVAPPPAVPPAPVAPPAAAPALAGDVPEF